MSQLVPLFSSYLHKEEPSLTMYSDTVGDSKMVSVNLIRILSIQYL